MGDQMAPGQPDSERSCCLFAKYQGLLNKCEQKQASFDDQIVPGDQIGRPDFHILVTSKIWSSIWSPGVIWSPNRSPEHLVINLVVVDAFTFSTWNGMSVKFWNPFHLFRISRVSQYGIMFTATSFYEGSKVSESCSIVMIKFHKPRINS